MSGDDPAARDAFTMALKLDPSFDQAHIELAIEKFHQGSTAPAIAMLKEIILRRPRQARAIETLANFLEQLDELPTAVSLRRKAIEIDASNQWSHLQLAQSLAKLGQVAEARQVLANCGAKFGQLPAVLLADARMRKDFGDYAGAHAVLAKAAVAFPSHFEVLSQMVTSLIFRGDFDAARRAAEALPASNVVEKARRCVLRAEIALAQWDCDAADAHFIEALALRPMDPGINSRAALTSLFRIDLESVKQRLETSTRFDPVHRNQHRGAWKPSQTQIGQLLDEFRMDRSALARLRAAVTQQDAIPALARLVLDMPDYTPASMLLLIAMRRKGLFAPSEGAGRKAPSIPDKIVQYWDDDIPADVAALCEGWRTSHPTFSYRRISLGEARRFLGERGPPGALAAFNRAAEPAMKADLFRLAYLFHEGGYYIDADDRCLAPIPTIAPGGHDLVLYQEDYGTVGNNFIGARPGHPAIGRALRGATDALNRGDNDILWLSTGPGLLTRSVASYLAEDVPEKLAEDLAEDLAEGLEKTLILERHELYRVDAIHTLTGYKYTKRNWQRTAFRRRRAISPESLAEIVASVGSR